MKIFADGADLNLISRQIFDPRITGFTLNTTLMKKAGVTDYLAFAKELLSIVPDPFPVSLPILSNNDNEMFDQAVQLSWLGENVYVKVPIVHLNGCLTSSLISRLTSQGIKVNITAIMTFAQVSSILSSIEFNTPAILSVFAGRIANSGRDPIPVMREIHNLLHCSGSLHDRVELLWASVREPLNVIHAEQSGCDIITLPPEMLSKLNGFGVDLDVLSQQTVDMFYRDGISYKL